MRRSFLHAAATTALLLASATAHAAPRPLTPGEKKVIGERLARAVNWVKRLDLPEGDTQFVVKRVVVDSKKIRAGAADYEGVVTGVEAPKGIVVHDRVDEVKLEKNGKDTEVVFRYAIHVEPGTKSGGPVEMTLQLLERVGLANSVLTVPVQHTINVTKPVATRADLAADFAGYRVYMHLAQERQAELRASRVDVSLRDRDRMPPMDRMDAKTAASVFEFEKWRRRAWVAVRHLQTAAKGPDAELAALAKTYFGALNATDEQLEALPKIPFASDSEGAGEAQVETLKPEPEKVAEKPPAKPPAKGGVETLKSLEEGGRAEPKAGAVGPSADERESAQAETEAPRAVTPQEEKAQVAEAPATPPPPVNSAEAEFRAREEAIPTYPRTLTLDDPNVGFGASVRFGYASVSVLEKATSPVFFFSAEAALTKDFGLEATLPTAYVTVDVTRARPIYTLGNLLVAAKYRLHLPKVLERRPVLTIRGRWGIPISALNQIPPTQLGAEDFSFPANAADTYAFLLEKHDFGLGVSSAWMFDMFEVAAQLYADYFRAVSGSINTESFMAMSYGISAGVWPIGDWVGGFLEARGTTLFVGPRRTDFFGYAGVRSRLFKMIEPSVWVALPIGSVSRASSVQIGAELRFAYDVESVIVHGRGGAVEEPSLLE